jgi:copper chaperone
MMNFTVSGMTCGGCVNAVTRAVQSKDPTAIINIDLSTQHVNVNTILTIDSVKQLITDAGFPVLHAQQDHA